jgi:hypothetical protein
MKEIGNTRCVEVLQCVLKMLLKLSVVQTIKPSVSSKLLMVGLCVD